MRKSIASVAVGLCVISALPLFAHAQDVPVPEPKPAEVAPPAAAPTAAPTAPTPSNPTPAPDGRVGTADGSEIYGEIGYWILSLFAWLTGVAGVSLNAAVYYTVVSMAQFVDGLPAIIVAWRILRDIGNIALIFGFIAIGLATILDIQSYNAKKMLVKLIIVAVTVNFSLFAARAIIDVGNVFAYQFYSQMVTPGQSFSPADDGISNAIMQMVGLQRFYSEKVFNEQSPRQQVLENNSVFAFILGSMLFLVAAFVMFALAIMLVARFVILVFLMIMSPLGFIGLIVPALEKRAKDWWSMLIAQSATAPVLLLLVLISVTLMTGASGMTHSERGYSALFGTNPSADSWLDTANMIIGFFISMGFLMASLIIAKQAGAFGASFAVNSSRRALDFALAPISRPARAVGRAVGREAGQRGAYAGLWAAEKAYKYTGAAALLKGSTLDADIAKKFEDKNKVKVLGRSRDDQEKAREHRAHELHTDEQKSSLKTAIRSGDETAVAAALQKMEGGDIASVIKKASESEVAAIGKALSPEKFEKIMDNKDIDSGIKDKMREGRFSDLAGNHGQGGLMRMSQTELDALQTSNPAEYKRIKDRIRRMTAKDLEQMVKYDAQAFESMMNLSNEDGESLLSDDQLEAAQKSNHLSANLRTKAKENTRVGRVDTAVELAIEADKSGNTSEALKLRARATQIAVRMNSKEKGKLKSKSITDAAVRGTIVPNDIQTFLAENSVKADDLQDIMKEVKKLPTTDSRRQKFDYYFDNNGLAESVIGYKKL